MNQRDILQERIVVKTTRRIKKMDRRIEKMMKRRMEMMMERRIEKMTILNMMMIKINLNITMK